MMIVISGSDTFLSRKCLGETVRELSSSKPDLDPFGIGSGPEIQIWTEDHPPDLTAALQDRNVWHVVYRDGEIRGNTKLGKFVSTKMAANLHKHFPLPKDYRIVGDTAAWLAGQIPQGMKWGHAVYPQAIVERIGTDKGQLSFELLKLRWLLNGSGTVGVEHLSGSLGAGGDLSTQPLLEALYAKDVKKTATWLDRFGSDQVMALSGLIGSCFVQVWAAARGAQPSELGCPDYVYSNVIKPAAKVWGPKGSVSVVSLCSEVQRAVKGGSVLDPYRMFSGRLLWLVVDQ